jgi:putative transposase
MEPDPPHRAALQPAFDAPLHLIQRSRGRTACFLAQRDGLAYLHWLGVYAARYRCAVHAYVLMSNHVHLLVTPEQAGGGARLMQALGSRYARHALESHGRAGPLWEEPFEAAPVYAPRYLLACMRYIEDNPVRAGLVADPDAWRWSSYGANAWGREDPLVTPHPRYCALGHTPDWRRARYRAMFWRSPEQRLAAKGDSR